MKRILAVSLALLLCLSGCAAMLEREYTAATPHEEDQPPQIDAGYRVESYPALRSAVLSYVEEGMSTGLLRFPTTYPGNLTVDLEKARRQLMDEEPLGSYALADVSWHTSRIIAYYEVELAFTYKLPAAAFVSLPRARSQSELARLLGESIERGEDTLAISLTAYPEGDESFFSGALETAWAARYAPEGPDGAPDAPADEDAQLPPMPELSVELYPQSGVRRIAVLSLSEPAAEPAEGEGAM